MYMKEHNVYQCQLSLPYTEVCGYNEGLLFYYHKKSIMSNKYLLMGSVHCHSLNLNLQLSGCQGTARTSSQMTNWRWLVLSPLKHLGHLEREGRVG